MREWMGDKSGVFSTLVSFCRTLNKSKESYLSLSLIMGHFECGFRWVCLTLMKSQWRAQKGKGDSEVKGMGVNLSL